MAFPTIDYSSLNAMAHQNTSPFSAVAQGYAGQAGAMSAGQAGVNTQNQQALDTMAFGTPTYHPGTYANPADPSTFHPGGPTTYSGGAMGAASSILNTAFDPQKALYNQQSTISNNANNVAEAQRGLTMSPYGAKMAADNSNNFNIDWQNAQLGRQTQGLNSYNQTMGEIGSAANTGMNMGNNAVSQTAQAGQIPLAASYQQSPDTQNQAIMAYLSSMNGGQSGNVFGGM